MVHGLLLFRMRLVKVFSLAEQRFQVQLQASDGGVEGVELSAFLSGSPCPVAARGPRLGLKVSVKVEAALHFAETARQSVMEGLGHGGDGPVERRRRRKRRGGVFCGSYFLRLLYSARREEKGQPTETFGALTDPQLEQHLH